MEENDQRVDEALDLIAKIFPDKAEQIATVAFVNWHNIVNHASLETLGPKEVLFITNLILAIASSNFDTSSVNTLSISNALKEVSFDEALEFLGEPTKEKKQRRIKKPKEDDDSNEG